MIHIPVSRARTSTVKHWTILPVPFKESPRIFAVSANGRRSDARPAACRLQDFRSAACTQLRSTTQAIESSQPAADEVPTDEGLAHYSLLRSVEALSILHFAAARRA
jgi:hypothetical protein